MSKNKTTKNKGFYSMNNNTNKGLSPMKKEVLKTKVSLSDLNLDSQTKNDTAMTFKEYHDKVKIAYEFDVVDHRDCFEVYLDEEEDGDAFIYICHDMGINYDMDITFGKLNTYLMYKENQIGGSLISIAYPFSERLFENLDHEKDLISVKSLENAIFNTEDFKEISDGKIKDFDSFLEHMGDIVSEDVDVMFKIIGDMKGFLLNSVQKLIQLRDFEETNKNNLLSSRQRNELLEKFEIESKDNTLFEIYQIKGSYYLLATTYETENAFYDLIEKYSQKPYFEDTTLLIKDFELTKLEIIHH